MDDHVISFSANIFFFNHFGLLNYLYFITSLYVRLATL